jgi:hypothetical protein
MGDPFCVLVFRLPDFYVTLHKEPNELKAGREFWEIL